MKHSQNIEAELVKLKSLYEKEFDQMKSEIENLALQRNKYALDNFNLELKLKDFFIKFEDVKKTNEELEMELRATKSKLNRAEFELENAKLESEKPLRENKQLRKDLDDLIAKMNELQSISDSEISYRQQLEKKLKEISDTSSFKEKLGLQELENYKSQFESLQTSFDELNDKYSDSVSRGKNLELENNSLRTQLATIKQTCTNLQTKVNTLEAKIERQKDNDSAKSNINPIKVETSDARSNQSRVSFHSNVIDDISNQTKSLMTFDPNRNSSDMMSQTAKKPLSQVRFQKLQSSSLEPNNVIDLGSNFIVHSSGVSSPLFSPSSIIRRDAASLINQPVEKPKEPQISPPKSALNRDFTKELFNQLEKKILPSSPSNEINTDRIKRDLNSSLSSIDCQTVTEASYVGNVKIHEVNKNGYYIRLLNVSNSHEEDLSNYSIQQMVSTMPVAVFRFPHPTKLAPGNTITVWSRTDEVEQEPPHTFVWNEQKKWGTGPECTTILAKPNGQAVSWTTGCHKYGNIALKDYDEIVSVYNQKRSKTSVFLERNKLVPQKFYTPTKHPYGMASMKSNGEIIQSSRGTDTFSSTPIQRNSITRPRSSATITSNPTSLVCGLPKHYYSPNLNTNNISPMFKIRPSSGFTTNKSSFINSTSKETTSNLNYFNRTNNKE